MFDDSSDRLAADLRRTVGRSAAGTRLPTSRSLSAAHGVSPVTVAKALRALVSEGLVETRPGVGTFVRAVRATRRSDHGWQTSALRSLPPRTAGPPSSLADTRPELVALHAGYPDGDLLPQRLVRASLQRAARSASAASRPPGAGLPDLRAWFAERLTSSAPAGPAAVTSRDVVVVPGSQTGLGSVLRSLTRPGDSVLVESPTYWGMLLSASRSGLVPVPVRTTPSGPDPADLARAFDETGARVFYAQPRFANPTGVSWSRELATQILQVVTAHGAFLVEDDWAHDLAIDAAAAPLASLDDSGRVIHLASLSKSLSPSLRVGAVIARGPVRERIAADQQAESLYVSELLQAAALDALRQPAWPAHLRVLARALRARRDALVAAVRDLLPGCSIPVVPGGGLHLWLQLPDGSDAPSVLAAAATRGVQVTCGDEFYATEPAGPHLRLSWAAADPAEFPAAIAALAEVIRG